MCEIFCFSLSVKLVKREICYSRFFYKSFHTIFHILYTIILVTRSITRLIEGQSYRNITRMIDAQVTLTRNPRAEMLAVALRPPRKINRRQSVDDSSLRRAPTPIVQRRNSTSAISNVIPVQQMLTRAETLQRLQMPGLLQLDAVINADAASNDSQPDDGDDASMNADATDNDNQADDDSMDPLHVDTLSATSFNSSNEFDPIVSLFFNTSEWWNW